MTTPRPTAELVTSPPDLTGAPDLPDWLPDEATLNRLAGEFFAALPGSSPAGASALGSPLPGSTGPAGLPTAPMTDSPGGLANAAAPTVPIKVSVRASIMHRGWTCPRDRARSPGSRVTADPASSPVAASPVDPSLPVDGRAVAGGGPDLPGVAATEPAAGSGYSPGRSIPDLTEFTSGLLGSEGLGPVLPEGPIVPGLTGLQLADPGELTPAIPGSTAPRPDEPIPGLPASDQLVGAGGLPNGPPDVTAPMSPGGLSPSAGPPEGVGSVPFSTAGGLAVPSAPGGEQIPPLQGLAGPLPSAGVPGVPASDQVLGGLGAPSGPPDLTAGSGAATTGAGLGAPAPAADQHRTPFAIPAGPTTPTMPAVPGVPGVTGATGALPGAPAPSDPVPTDAATRAAAGSPADVETGDPVPDGLSMPATPQPPVAVPDAPVPVPTPSTPYYFVAETSPYRGATEPGLDTLASAALSPSQVNPPTVDSLPGATGSLPKQPNLSDQPQTLQSPAFYFADRTPTSPSPGAAVGFPDPHPPFDVALVRRDFPILSERVNGKPLVWLDNAATTQKPQAVLDRLAHFYRHENSNIHRAAHELAARATDAYEGARKTVARFIGAGSEKDIVFVRGATEAINLVAKSWGRKNIHRGDEIIISHLEHHANIVPWQQLISETGAKLRVIPVDDSGQILLGEYAKLLCDKTKLVSVTQVSNALGTVTPDPADRRDGAPGGRLRADRRGTVGAAPAGEPADARGRLLRLLRAQDLRPDRDRRALRQARGARVHAAVGGRRQHDRRRDLREDRVPASAQPVRGRHRQHRRRRRPRRRARLRDPDRAGDGSPTTSIRCWSTRRRGCAPSAVYG